MVLYNGDRVVFKDSSRKPYFGRIVEFNEDSRTSNDFESVESFLTGHGNDASNSKSSKMPGFTSPVIMKSKSEPDLGAVVDGNRKGMKKQVVWDDSSQETPVSLENERMFQVVDRMFSVGQNVFRNGQRGKIVERIPLVTVKIVDSELGRDKQPYLIPDVPMSCLRPIKPSFYGVSVEYKGWIGQVSDAQRRVVYRLDDTSAVSYTFNDSLLLRKSHSKSTGSSKQTQQTPPKLSYGYPFLSHADFVPYEGRAVRFSSSQLKKFRKEEEADKENNVSYCSVTSPHRSSSCCAELKTKDYFIAATVESIVDVSITVRWTGRLPAYLIKPTEKAQMNSYFTMPPRVLREEDLRAIRPLYIHPTTYFDKKGLCLCTVSEEARTNEFSSMVIPERKWTYELYKRLELGESRCENGNDSEELFNSSSLTPPAALRKDSEQSANAKRKWNHDDETSTTEKSEKKEFVVCKHFVRHMYKVIWENPSGTKKNYFMQGETGFHYGHQLEPDLQQEHKLCLGRIHSHLYVVPRKGTWMDGQWDYGVVIEKPCDNSVVVEWLQITADGDVEIARILKCDLVEIDKHPTFNELHEGRIVVRTREAENYTKCDDFTFGTVVSIQRFSLGQVSVYCPLQEKIVELWPHMLQVFEGMSMHELIAHKVVGLKRSRNSDENMVRK